MKIIFAGTPEFAVPSLRALHGAGHEITVLTQPDRPQGRKKILTPPPVKAEAERLGLAVLQPERLKGDFSSVAAVGAELMVTCAYGQILTQEVLDLFPKGVWNVHASLLPAYRGAAPIARAVIDGEKKTGVTIMKTDVGLDTGDIFLTAEVKINEGYDTCGSLTEELSEVGAKLITEALGKIAAGDVALTKQGEGFVCKKVFRTEVDFSKGCKEVARLINGLSPAPLAYANVEGMPVNFYRASSFSQREVENVVPYIDWSMPCGAVLVAEGDCLFIMCGDGYVSIEELQLAGGKRLKTKEFLNGRKIRKGMRFDQPVL